MRLAGAPISWGVCEVPGWGVQLSAQRVFDEMQDLGMDATEAGPPGFLSADAFAARRLLRTHGLRLVGGFVTAVLHDPAVRAVELAAVERSASWLAALGADVLVLAAATGATGYAGGTELDDAAWTALFGGLDDVARIAVSHRLTLAVHPHWGTVIERGAHVDRVLAGCAHGLCLDTGHLALGGADPLDVARRAGERVRHVHLKDVDGALAAAVRAGTLDYAAAVRRGLYRALGEGDAGIAAVLAHLRDRGYDGWQVLEQDVMLSAEPAGAPADVVRSAAFARAHG